MLLAMPTTRRQFVASGALATAAAGANDAIRVGLIGCGGRGRSLLELFQTDPSCRIVAICDVDQGRVAETRTSLSPPPDTYSDFRRLLERKDKRLRHNAHYIAAGLEKPALFAAN